MIPEHLTFASHEPAGQPCSPLTGTPRRLLESPVRHGFLPPRNRMGCLSQRLVRKCWTFYLFLDLSLSIPISKEDTSRPMASEDPLNDLSCAPYSSVLSLQASQTSHFYNRPLKVLPSPKKLFCPSLAQLNKWCLCPLLKVRTLLHLPYPIHQQDLWT